MGCEQRVPLWDEMEQCFASREIQQRVRDLQEESAIELSNQSKERSLVGEVVSTVALADQISREFNVSDEGIDMEIECTDDAHEATGAKLYLQLKSGDSYLRERKSDGAESFTIIRRVEDLDSAALTYAEVKAIASGNPLVIEKAQVDAELMRLTWLRSAHAEEQYRIRGNPLKRSILRRHTAKRPWLKTDLPLHEPSVAHDFNFLGI